MFGCVLFFITPFPFLVIKDPHAESSRILVEPHLMVAEFVKAWMPFFCRSGHPVVTPDQFLDFVGHLLPQEPHLDLPRIYGVVTCRRWLVLKKSTAGVWMGGDGMKLRHFRYPGSLVWLFFGVG